MQVICWCAGEKRDPFPVEFQDAGFNTSQSVAFAMRDLELELHD